MKTVYIVNISWTLDTIPIFLETNFLREWITVWKTSRTDKTEYGTFTGTSFLFIVA